MDILVTGATGFVGRWLVVELSKRGHQVGACMRNAGQREEEYLTAVESKGGIRKHVRCVEMDVCALQSPWEEELYQSVQTIFHTAALFRFGLTEKEAYRTNVEGSLRVAQWASTLPKLEHFIALSGYRLVSPTLSYLRSVYVLSKREKRKLFAQHGAYEASKIIEYVLLRGELQRLSVPYSIVHPATVIGESSTGETQQYIGLAQTMKELFYGELPALLGHEDVFLPVITVDYVAQFMAQLVDFPESRGQEYCLLDQDTPKMHALLRWAGRYMGVQVPRRTLSVNVLKAVPRFVLGEQKEALSFLTSESYDTASADALAERMHLPKPPIFEALSKWLDWMTAHRFGTLSSSFTGQWVGKKNRVFMQGKLAQPESILLHGLPLEGTSWLKWMTRAEHPTLQLELPNVGISSSTGVEFGSVDWIEEALPETASPALWVGHSLGSLYALQYAVDYPEHVKGLVLLSPFFLQKRAAWIMRRPWLSQWLFRSLSVTALHKLLMGTESPEPMDWIESIHSTLRRPGQARYVAQALAWASELQTRKNALHMLHTISCPTLLIAGSKDPILNFEQPPHCTHFSVEGAGHYVQLTHGEEVQSVIQKWKEEHML